MCVICVISSPKTLLCKNKSIYDVKSFLQSLQPVSSLQVCLCVCACFQSKVTNISLMFVDFILLVYS